MRTSPQPHQQTSPAASVDFWFSEAVRPLWFNATDAFDTRLREDYLALWQTAARGELDHWGETAQGALALVIILDQFPLNMFRGKPASFSTEAHSRRVAEQAIAMGLDQELDDPGNAFLYLPFMHSEDLTDQDRSVQLYERAGLTQNLPWAKHHRDIVRRFGRFPHRNAILGRPSRAE